MIDTIWLILHHSTVNYKIDFMAEVGAKINVDIKRSNEYRIVGSLQNMQIDRKSTRLNSSHNA